MRLLIIRLSSIGDIVFTTAAIRCAKEQIPGVEIHFLTKKSLKAVTEANPYIDHFHYHSTNLAETIASLKAANLDMIIDLHNNFRTFRIKKALGLPAHTYKKLSLQKWVLTRFGINLLPDTHIVERSLDPLKVLGVRNDGKGMDYFVPSSVSLKSKDIPTSHQAGYIAIVIGASYATKRMPVEQLKALCALITVPIILIGGKEDTKEGEEVASIDQIKIYNACGKFNLHESALLVKGSRMVISNDTGFLHIACAFHKKTIAIWGATSPALQVSPYYALSDLQNGQDMFFNAIVTNLPCQPCSKYGTKTCPQGHFACMKKQDLSFIAEKAMQYYLA
jgi:ADP-heptose:LPS heptosyltransferase